MKFAIGAVGAFLFVAMLAVAPPAQARKAVRARCPSHWSLMGDVCISDRTGDVMMARKKGKARN